MKPAYLAKIPQAQAALRATGERVTDPRVAVLSTLLSCDHAVSQLDVATMIEKYHTIDRVTVYRVLDWLVGVGIAHRIAGDDRVWRFMLNTQTGSHPSRKTASHQLHEHAHFTCNTCGQTFCLDNVQPKVNGKLPAGFSTTEVDLKIRGLCAECK
jgi:Fur family transcriptional regulator, ferric uptake regulator